MIKHVSYLCYLIRKYLTYNFCVLNTGQGLVGFKKIFFSQILDGCGEMHHW